MSRWIIVGAGTGGIVAAARLAERGDREVLLVEAGPADTTPDRGDSFFDALASPGRVHGDLAAARVIGGPVRPYLRGRGLGGSGSVNAMVALEGGSFRAAHRLHAETVAPVELGPVDRALLAASPDAIPVPLTRRDGHRVTVDDCYPLDGVEVRGDSPVDRIELDGRRAVGVRLVDGTELDADHVVLSAGAISSPAVLLRSGVTVPGIGQGLKDHPSAPLTLALRADATSDPSALASAVMLLRDDMQVLPLNHVGSHAPGYGVLLPALMRVRSEGFVGLDPDRPDDPTAPPHVELRMLSHPGDLAALAAAVRHTLDLLGHAAFARIVERVLIDDAGTEAEALAAPGAVEAWLPEHVGDYVHAACTCRMGVVVDDHGRVFGHDALYVCDASVFSEIPEVNTNLPTVMLAETLVGRWLTR